MDNVVLSGSQDNALDAFRTFIRDESETEFLLCGHAGSGKSFLVTYMVDVVKDEHRLARLIAPNLIEPHFNFTATTNKAAKVLRMMINGPATTVHQALGYTVKNNYKTGKQELKRSQQGPTVALDYSILVVDEASMVNAELLGMIRHDVRDATNCKVLFVGDSYQLPPVKEHVCPVFVGAKNQAFLTDIVRQAADSPIIQFSMEYRKLIDNPEGQSWPHIPEFADGFHIAHYTDPAVWKRTLALYYKQYQNNVDEIRSLAWRNEHVRSWNNWIRKQLGFEGLLKPGEMVLSNTPLMKDNRMVLQTDALAEVIDISAGTDLDIPGHYVVIRPGVDPYCTRPGSGPVDSIRVFMPGDWQKVRQALAIAASEKDWRKFFRMKNEWADLRAPFAQTVHKSQGSTYDVVFIDVSDIIHNRKWHEVARLMYVALTRARTQVHVFGNLDGAPSGKNNPHELMEAFRHASLQTPDSPA